MTDAHAARSVFLALCLTAVALTLRTPTLWTGVAFVIVWTVLALAGVATLGLVFPAAEPSTLLLLVMATAQGIASAVVLWSASALVFKHMGMGTAALLCLSMVGLRRAHAAWKSRRTLSSVEAFDATLVTIAALALGLYVNGFNEIQKGDTLRYTFRFDWESHLHWTQLVREQGLPLVGSSGVGSVPFAALTHTGLLCLVAGIQEATRVGPYGAARILGVGAFPLLALAALAGLEGRALGRWAALAGLSALVWGGIGLPIDILAGNRAGVLDPYLGGVAPMTVASGTLYHNLTQLLSVVLAAAALSAVNLCLTRREFGGLLAAGALLGASWLLKPSTPLLVMPALIPICLVARVPPRAVALLCASFAACVTVYFLPALLVELPPGPRFEARIPPMGATLLRIAVAVGLGGAVVARTLSNLLTRSVGPRARDAVVLAVLGGIVMDACLLEPGRVRHANSVWPLAAALVLLAPEMTASAVEWARRPPFRGARLAVLTLLGVHLLTGLAYLVRYPWLRRLDVPLSSRAALDAVQKATRPGRRVLVDLALIPAAAYPYLGRPSALPNVNVIQPDEIRDAAEWLGVNRGSSPDSPALDRLLVGCDGVVTGPQTRQLRRLLRLRGWRAEEIELPPGYRLSIPPAANAATKSRSRSSSGTSLSAVEVPGTARP